MTFNLTQREKEILELVSYEFSTHEIANQLFLSHHTILTHRKNLMNKFKVRNTAGLMRKGFEQGFLNLYTRQSA